jgi:hypothetical protein
MSKYNELNEGNRIAKKMFAFLVAALLPFLCIVAIYVINPASGILNDVALKTIELPAIYSSKSPLLSKVMDVYVKTAPFVAFALFIFTYKTLRLKGNNPVYKVLALHVFFTIFYMLFVYVFLFTNTELTTSSKLLKLMSKNEISLTFFYVSLYAGVYVFSYLYMWFCIGTYRALKERL